MPIKNKRTIEIESSDIVRGSVDGVIIADKMAEEITTMRQFAIILLVEMMPSDPKINCSTGNWNAIAVLDINNSTKSKYLSIDQIGSTISAPNLIKKLIAAGTSIHQEKSNPIKKSTPEPNTAGNIRVFSCLVSPGEINKMIW